jgi:hypothetical protein
LTLSDISALAEIIGGLAVIGSLIFVGLQIRDNSRAVRSATAQAVHDNYAGWYLALIGEPKALAVSARGFVDYDGLAPDEKAQFVCIFMAFLSHSQNAFHQWKAGHLSDELWRGWEALMMNLVNTKGGAAFWRERSYVFGRAFEAHVGEIMKRTPDPRARAFGVVPLSQTPAA